MTKLILSLLFIASVCRAEYVYLYDDINSMFTTNIQFSSIYAPVKTTQQLTANYKEITIPRPDRRSISVNGFETMLQPGGGYCPTPFAPIYKWRLMIHNWEQ